MPERISVDALRRSVGLLTLEDAGRIAGCGKLAIARAITLGHLPLNQTGTGVLLVDEGTLRVLVSSDGARKLSVPSLNHDSSWFAPFTGMTTQADFAAELRAAIGPSRDSLSGGDPMEAAIHSALGRPSVATAINDVARHFRDAYSANGREMLLTELRSHMRYRLRHASKTDALAFADAKSPIEQLYAMGPDRFREHLNACRERLHAMHFSIGEGNTVALSKIAGNRLTADINNAIRKAF